MPPQDNFDSYEWIGCDGCFRWNHEKCEAKHGRSLSSSGHSPPRPRWVKGGKYTCPVCTAGGDSPTGHSNRKAHKPATPRLSPKAAPVLPASTGTPRGMEAESQRATINSITFGDALLAAIQASLAEAGGPGDSAVEDDAAADPAAAAGLAQFGEHGGVDAASRRAKKKKKKDKKDKKKKRRHDSEHDTSRSPSTKRSRDDQGGGGTSRGARAKGAEHEEAVSSSPGIARLMHRRAEEAAAASSHQSADSLGSFDGASAPRMGVPFKLQHKRKYAAALVATSSEEIGLPGARQPKTESKSGLLAGPASGRQSAGLENHWRPPVEQEHAPSKLEGASPAADPDGHSRSAHSTSAAIPKLDLVSHQPLKAALAAVDGGGLSVKLSPPPAAAVGDATGWQSAPSPSAERDDGLGALCPPANSLPLPQQIPPSAAPSERPACR